MTEGEEKKNGEFFFIERKYRRNSILTKSFFKEISFFLSRPNKNIDFEISDSDVRLDILLSNIFQILLYSRVI